MAHVVKGRQYNKARSTSVPQSQRSTLDLDSRQKRQVDVPVTETNSTVQYRSVPYSYVARVRVLHALYAYACYIIALASFIYTPDYVSQKNA